MNPGFLQRGCGTSGVLRGAPRRDPGVELGAMSPALRQRCEAPIASPLLPADCPRQARELGGRPARPREPAFTVAAIDFVRRGLVAAVRIVRGDRALGMVIEQRA